MTRGRWGWIVGAVLSAVAGCATVVSRPPPMAPGPEVAARGVEGSQRLAERPLVLTRPCWTPTGAPRVLAIGSSTMGSAIGPMLRRSLGARGVYVAVKAKSSSSLARPDFFDWPATLQDLVRREAPDLVVVALGVNDAQTVVAPRRKGVKTDDPRWDAAFAERVDALLAIASGPEGRPVVWIGPYAFRGRASREVGRRIHRILQERLAAWRTPAFYVDAYTTTLDASGRPIDTWRLPGERQSVTARGRDGIHLKQYVVRPVMVDPAVIHVTQCLRPPER